jgi:hypothetical protein
VVAPSPHQLVFLVPWSSRHIGVLDLLTGDSNATAIRYTDDHFHYSAFRSAVYHRDHVFFVPYQWPEILVVDVSALEITQRIEISSEALYFNGHGFFDSILMGNSIFSIPSYGHQRKYYQSTYHNASILKINTTNTSDVQISFLSVTGTDTFFNSIEKSHEPGSLGYIYLFGLTTNGVYTLDTRTSETFEWMTTESVGYGGRLFPLSPQLGGGFADFNRGKHVHVLPYWDCEVSHPLLAPRRHG